MTAIEPETTYPIELAPSKPEISLRRRVGRGLRTFSRRNPLSAFWGCIAALILVMALAAPLIAPYPPLKSDFRHMTNPPAAPHYFSTAPMATVREARLP